ncbi:MAG: tetratricopeptide repeat protein [Elusimicrobiales bacterium]
MKLTLLTLIYLFSQQPNIQDEAALYYKENNFKSALELYSSMISKDPLNPYLYYNAANCHYKLGNRTMALAYYIKSFILNPRNKDNLSNLKKISTETSNTLFSDEIPQTLYTFYFLLSDYELRSAIHIMFIILSIILILWLFCSKLLKKLLIITLILLIFFSTWYIMRKNSIFYSPAITLKETDILSGPGNKFMVLATIPQSKVLFLIKENDDFAEVGIPEQNIKGWIKKEDIIKIKGEKI